MHPDEREYLDFTVDDAYAFACRLRGDPAKMNEDSPASGSGVAQWSVKVYAGGNRIRLPECRPWWLNAGEPAQSDQMSRLSEMLTYSAGITRVIWRPGGTAISSPQRPNMVWPEMRLGHRRTVPSGGSMYPVEVYVVNLVGNAGVFHYDPARHELVDLEHPSAQDSLRAALALPRGELMSPLWILLTHRFGKNTHKYGSFAYRLGSADMGVIWSRISDWGSRLFGSVSTRVDFDDAAINRLCGNQHLEESAYLVVGLGEPVVGAEARGDSAVSTGGANPPPVVSRGPAAALSPAFVAMHRCSSTVAPRLGDARDPGPTVGDGMAEGRAPLLVPRGARVDKEIRLAPSVRAAPPGPRALALRKSAGAYFVAKTVDVSVLETVLFCTMEAIHRLRRTYADGDAPNLHLLCGVDRVRTIPAGWFSYSHESNGLVPIEGPGTVPPSRELQEALHIKTVDIERSAFSIHVAGELDFRAHPRGARAYRCQQIFIGAAIDAITCWSIACGVGSHPLHGFDSARIDRCYGLEDGPFGVLAQVAVGHTRPNGTLECSVIS